MKTTIFLFFTFLLFANIISAQNHIVNGVVNTLDSIPLIGVEVKVKSTNQVYLTDTLGRFTAVCNDEDNIRFRAKGFFDQKVKVPKNIKLIAVNLKFKPGKKQIEYAIGYGYVSEKNRTTAISNFESSRTGYSRYNDMYSLIQSELGGVQVSNGKISMGGSRTFQGSDEVLIVVDGVISESDILRTLSPVEIKSINVLKDGSSSIYGSRGANGVILIETKKGGDN